MDGGFIDSSKTDGLTRLLPYVLPACVLMAFAVVRIGQGWTPWFLALGASLAVYASLAYVLRRAARSGEEKSRVSDQLIQSQKLAALGELSSGIAHEINTPLAVIGQEAELLLMSFMDAKLGKLDESAEIRDSLNQIIVQVNRCGEITRKLLNFAREMEAISQETDINGLVEDMVLLVEKDAGYNNIRIVRQYALNSPVVVTDPSLLRQVVLNLLNNAVQAVSKDGAVYVCTEAGTDGCASIKIRDTGGGIPKENLSRIFNPFFTTKPPGKGTGLGLSICMTIVQRLGGEMFVMSEPGMGAEFEVRLPVGTGVKDTK